MSNRESPSNSRPNTPKVRAGDHVIDEITLPSNRVSLESMGNFNLQSIDQNEKVRKGDHIIRDKKTGKHYKKVEKPAYSLARSKGASKVDNSAYHGAAIGLGHAMKGQRGGEMSHSAVTSQNGGHDSSNSALLEQLRLIIREEVRMANYGQHEMLKEHVETAVEQASQQQPPSEGSDATQKGDKLVKRASDDNAILDPRVAQRGLIDGEEDEEDEDAFPNWWAKIRYNMREPFAEFLACFVLLTFGDGINVQVQLSQLVQPSMPKGEYLSISFGWGIAVMMAIYVAGGISGGHINPAITLSLAVYRGFPWRKVPGYWAGQLAGGVMGALCIYGLYCVPIRMIDPEQTQQTAQLFTTFPAQYLVGYSQGRAITAYNEIYATAILLIVVLAIGDSNNTPPVEGMAPLVLMWLVTGIGATLGWQTAYAINPIRDWGPRIALTIVGYEGLWSYESGYFAYTPFASIFAGALLGSFFYDVLIYDGGESWVNKPWRWNKVSFGSATKKKMPAAIDP